MTDAQMLRILDLVDFEGQSFSEVAAGMGVTKGAVAGLVNRCRNHCDRDIGPALDGTMPRFWYKAGLRARA